MSNVKTHKVDIVNGPILKGLIIFSIPLIISNFLQVLFNMADVCVVGRFAGNIALGAVGSTTTLISLTTGFYIGLASGINSIVAFNLATKDENKIRKSVVSGFIISIVVGFFALMIGVVFAKNILQVLNTKSELIDEAVLYYRIYMLGAPALAIFNFSSASISASGDTKRPLYFLIIGGIVNVILNLIFVIVFKLSVLGVAIASVISQYLSMFLCLNHLMNKTQETKFNIKDVKADRYMVKSILSLGIPSALQYSLFSFINLYLQMAINSFSHIVVEGNAAAVNAEIFIFQAIDAIYIASTTFVAQNYGANKKDRVLKSFYCALLSACVLAIIGGILFYIFRVPFLSLFTTDKEVIEAGITRLTIMVLSIWISPFMDCSAAASRGLGKAVVPTIYIILGSVVFRFIWIMFVFSKYNTEKVLFLLFPISWIITGALETIYFFYTYKKCFLKEV